MKSLLSLRFLGASLACGLTFLGCGGPAGQGISYSTGTTLDPQTLVKIETGALPLVLSAPHGGKTDIPGLAVRTTGTTVQDTNTLQLAMAVQAQLLAKTGKKAYLVAALASRKYIDFNRPAEQAYESPLAAPVYEAYHTALKQAVAAAKVQSAPGALLVDIHGQSEDVTVAFRGTRDGETASLAHLYATPGGFLTALMTEGITVVPGSTTGAENLNFNGGYIVGIYGVSAAGIQAVQLEFGFNYRQNQSALDATAVAIANALIVHLKAQGVLPIAAR
jgi:N-formylglutamate amidohydrolase